MPTPGSTPYSSSAEPTTPALEAQKGTDAATAAFDTISMFGTPGTLGASAGPPQVNLGNGISMYSVNPNLLTTGGADGSALYSQITTPTYADYANNPTNMALANIGGQIEANTNAIATAQGNIGSLIDQYSTNVQSGITGEEENSQIFTQMNKEQSTINGLTAANTTLGSAADYLAQDSPGSDAMAKALSTAPATPQAAAAQQLLIGNMSNAVITGATPVTNPIAAVGSSGEYSPTDSEIAAGQANAQAANQSKVSELSQNATALANYINNGTPLPAAQQQAINAMTGNQTGAAAAFTAVSNVLNWPMNNLAPYADGVGQAVMGATIGAPASIADNAALAVAGPVTPGQQATAATQTGSQNAIDRLEAVGVTALNAATVGSVGVSALKGVVSDGFSIIGSDVAPTVYNDARVAVADEFGVAPEATAPPQPLQITSAAGVPSPSAPISDLVLGDDGVYSVAGSPPPTAVTSDAAPLLETPPPAVPSSIAEVSPAAGESAPIAQAPPTLPAGEVPEAAPPPAAATISEAPPPAATAPLVGETPPAGPIASNITGAQATAIEQYSNAVNALELPVPPGVSSDVVAQVDAQVDARRRRGRDRRAGRVDLQRIRITSDAVRGSAADPDERGRAGLRRGRRSAAGVWVEVLEAAGTIERFERCQAGVGMVHARDEAESVIEASIAVVAIGWVANTAELNLSAAGVALDERGYIRADAELRTTAPHIFAAGDVTGRLMVVHEATREAYLAATNAVLGKASALPPEVSPLGSFTDPEYASVGLTEAAAGATHEIIVATQRFDSLPRPIIDGRPTGFCKLIADRRLHTILGCHIVGERAVELAQLAAIAIAAGVKVEQLALVPFSFPTYANALGRAAITAAQMLGSPVGSTDDPVIGEVGLA